jgi:hypothetical protein
MNKAREGTSSDSPLVSVLKTEESGLLPLAKIALEQAGINYTIENRDLIIGYPSVMTDGESKGSLEVMVLAEDAARARELLRDLERAKSEAVAGAGTLTSAAGPAPAVSEILGAAAGAATVALFDAATGTPIGHITEDQLDTLSDHLEQESSDDDDYYIDEPTLTMLQEQQVDAGVIELLRRALANRAGMDVRWSRE